MRSTRTAVMTLATSAALLATPVAGARAEEDPVTVKVTGCQAVTMTSRETAVVPVQATRHFGGDGWPDHAIGVGSGTYVLPAGDYTWRLLVGDDLRPHSHGKFTLTRCPASQPLSRARLADGDENGDGRADVMAVRTDGRLMYYRRTATGLAPGIAVGHGWQAFDWIARAEDRQFMLARRTDGTLWRYERRGQGKYANATQIGTGFKGYTDLTLEPESSALHPGTHTLTGRRDGQVYTWSMATEYEVKPGTRTHRGAARSGLRQTIPLRDFNGDRWGDIIFRGNDGNLVASTTAWNGATRTLQVGHGWAGMTWLYSPGSVAGDRHPDLVARTRDGRLLAYPNTTSSGQHHWGTPTKLGTGWHSMRIIF